MPTPTTRSSRSWRERCISVGPCAAAASTIVDPSVRRALQREALVVWLHAAPATLAARMRQSSTRPFGGVDPSQLVARQSAERDLLFAQIADLSIESDDSTPDEVV